MMLLSKKTKEKWRKCRRKILRIVTPLINSSKPLQFCCQRSSVVLLADEKAEVEGTDYDYHFPDRDRGKKFVGMIMLDIICSWFKYFMAFHCI